MAIAKIVYKESAEATPEVWMDTTQKTVTAGSMLSGTTALKNDGTDITGNIASKSSSNLTASGATVTAPAGYYASDASKSVATGTAGTPTATKGTVSNHAVSVTPSVTNTEGYISGGTKTGTAVSVSASELVSGTKSIMASGTTDVTNYASASVAAGSAATPATSITANPTISVDSSGLITSSVSTSQSVTPTVSAGYVSSGAAGTVSVSGSNTEQLSTQAAATITPTTSQQVAVAAGKYTTGDVIVAPIPSNYIIPSGSFSAISNGTYNITSYASVIVDVANTLVSEGTDVSVDGTTVIIEDGGGGLEYEEGTWIPASDIARGAIMFADSHSNTPIFFAVADQTGNSAPDSNANVSCVFGDWYTVFGAPAISNNNTNQYASVRFTYGGISTGSQTITAIAGDTNVSLSYWATSGAIYPYTNSDSRYWRSGRTYKWIAVWAPTT